MRSDVCSFFFPSRRRHTRCGRDWSSDVCSSDLGRSPTYPRLIYAATSGFGHTGPWSRKPAYDLIVQALSGLMSITGQPGGPPTKCGTSVGDITGGLFTALGIASALYHRERTGEGMKIDVSI